MEEDGELSFNRAFLGRRSRNVHVKLVSLADPPLERGN